MKNIILRELFPHLKLKDKNLSLWKRIYIYINILAQLFVIVWICLYVLLPFVSESQHHYEGAIFHLHDKKYTIETTKNYLDDVHAYMRKNKLFNLTEEIEIHLLNDKLIYALLNPIEWLPGRQTFGITLGSKVFVRDADIAQNKSYASNDTAENLDAILVHEATHAMQHEKYGLFYTALKTPYWVREGYPIYSVRALSKYKEKPIIEYMIKTKDVNIKAWNVFVQDQFYGLMVKHAIEKMHKSVDALHLGEVNYDEVLDSLLREYNITK